MPGRSFKRLKATCFLFFLIPFLTGWHVLAQKSTTFSVTLDPAVTWFSNDRKELETKGAELALSYGLTLDHFFSEKYALSTGLSITAIGGNLLYDDTVLIRTAYDTVEIPQGTRMKYRLRYVSVPLGLKLKTVEIGYKTFFVDIGLKAMFRINAKASTKDKLLNKDKIKDEIQLFNMAYYFGAGMEYSLGESTAIVGGLYYTRSFLDITKDLNGKQPDFLNGNILSIKIGVLF
jgi:hypothetical protein